MRYERNTGVYRYARQRFWVAFWVSVGIAIYLMAFRLDLVMVP